MPTSSKIPEEERIFCLIVLKNKLSTKEALEGALREWLEVRKKGLAFLSFGEILISKNVLKAEQVSAVEKARDLYIRSRKVESIAGYRLVRKIGEGGMGHIYEARQLSLDRRVAIKILPLEMVGDEAVVKRFEREAKATAKLSHEHIVPVYDFGKIPGEYFMVMEYIDGYNLEQVIEKKGPLSEGVALGITRQIAEALAFAHANGIVHRDLKPNNIMITRQGKALLADLGLAKRLDGDLDSITKTGVVLGTPAFMAPEQIVSPRTVGPACDLYALGETLACMLAGKMPFTNSDTMEIVRELVDWKSPVKSLLRGARVSGAVTTLVEKMAAGRPEKRFQSADEVIREIDRIVEKQALPVEPLDLDRQPGEAPKRVKR
ncbi:MAG: serine/threonine protein kinase [Planctomycetes bacterium]|jgi:serine/threonine-protein kinase|nr:serine/threonine protein kinase [Planctomycetota bacterium]